jgi:DNA polymerase III gamma/tau subunit
MQESLITKYRPIKFEEVIGNEAAIRGLKEAVSSPSHHHTYLFTGPSGVGKTTLARIVARHFNCWVDELDAASNSGVEDMRGLVATTGFTSVFNQKNRAIIIDECHAISKQGWQPLLKLAEEPPPDLYLFFCTTEANKVPDTIKTRSHCIPLKPVTNNEIADLLEVVCEVEGWKVNNEVMNAIVGASTGQPRKALSILQAGHLCVDRNELARVVVAVETDNAPVLQLMYYLVNGGRDWGKVQGWLSQIEDEEEAWSSATRYLSNEIIRSKEEKARAAHKVLDALTFPRNGYDRKALFTVAVTSYLWN